MSEERYEKALRKFLPKYQAFRDNYWAMEYAWEELAQLLDPPRIYPETSPDPPKTAPEHGEDPKEAPAVAGEEMQPIGADLVLNIHLRAYINNLAAATNRQGREIRRLQLDGVILRREGDLDADRLDGPDESFKILARQVRELRGREITKQSSLEYCNHCHRGVK